MAHVNRPHQQVGDRRPDISGSSRRQPRERLGDTPFYENVKDRLFKIEVTLSELSWESYAEWVYKHIQAGNGEPNDWVEIAVLIYLERERLQWSCPSEASDIEGVNKVLSSVDLDGHNWTKDHELIMSILEYKYNQAAGLEVDKLRKASAEEVVARFAARPEDSVYNATVEKAQPQPVEDAMATNRPDQTDLEDFARPSTSLILPLPDGCYTFRPEFAIDETTPDLSEEGRDQALLNARLAYTCPFACATSGRLKLFLSTASLTGHLAERHGYHDDVSVHRADIPHRRYSLSIRGFPIIWILESPDSWVPPDNWVPFDA